MGFLKFLKRDKNKDMDIGLDDLDMPPLPPGMEGKGLEDLPELPEMPEFPGIEPAPRMEEKKSSVSEIKTPPLKQPMGMEEPVLPQLERLEPADEMETEFRIQRPEPMLPLREGIPVEPKPRRTDTYGRIKRAAVRQERSVLQHEGAKGPIFMRVDKFRNVLRGISEFRGSLKASNEILAKLNEIDANSDREFDKWKNVMSDLQKKLIFVDKTLFNSSKK